VQPKVQRKGFEPPDGAEIRSRCNVTIRTVFLMNRPATGRPMRQPVAFAYPNFPL
jgi:hypothetical protein